MPKMRYFTDSDGVERALPLMVAGPGTFQIIVQDDWDAKFTRKVQQWAMLEALEKLMAHRGADALPAGGFVVNREPPGITGKWVEWEHFGTEAAA